MKRRVWGAAARVRKSALPSAANLSELFNKAKTAFSMDAEKNNLALRPFDFSSLWEIPG